jgi:hypothetical protein
LPRLYRLRGEEGDESRAQTALQVTSAACERAIARGSGDEWVRPTMLGVAFDLGDPRKAEEIAVMVRREGADAERELLALYLELGGALASNAIRSGMLRPVRRHGVLPVETNA